MTFVEVVAHRRQVGQVDAPAAFLPVAVRMSVEQAFAGTSTNTGCGASEKNGQDDVRLLMEIPFELDVPTLLKRAHIVPDTDDTIEFKRLAQIASKIGRPKAGYREAFIDAKGEATVTIQGVTFESRMLRGNLEHAERVFPFVMTCGRELDQYWACRTPKAGAVP
jgi:hypothetical protein